MTGKWKNINCNGVASMEERWLVEGGDVMKVTKKLLPGAYEYSYINSRGRVKSRLP